MSFVCAAGKNCEVVALESGYLMTMIVVGVDLD